jgi:hypothetical protein
MKKVAGQEKNSEKQKGKKEKLKMVPSFILSPLGGGGAKCTCTRQPREP